jgi:uncharacterized damage-inducible protein DinB
MPIADALVPELDREIAITRSLLERVPDDKADWKPHPKSMSMGQLAIHIASLARWTGYALTGTEFDVSPVGGAPFVTKEWTSRADTLAELDAGASDARTTIAATSDADMLVPWSLKAGGKTIFTMPRAAVLRSFVLSHIIHHRGQLSVYLRLNDVPVPAIYGPSADEH